MSKKRNNKNKNIILYCIVGLVVIIALLIPFASDNSNKKDNNSSSVSVSTLTCDDDNPKSEHDTTLKTISCDEYNDIIKGNEEKLVLYARPTCGFCNKFVPVLEEILDSYDIEINYFDTDTLSEDETKDFYSSSSLMSGSEFGTPTLAVIKDGKILKYSIGYKEKSDAIDWLKDVGFINE